VEHRYHWGVAAEKCGKRSATNDKLRIYLIRDTTLKAIGAMIEQGQEPDWQATKRYNDIPQVAVAYFQKRFKNLGILYKHSERLANDEKWKDQSNLFIATVGLAFPAPSFTLARDISSDCAPPALEQDATNDVNE
jgi:hypothetical protein